MTTPKTSAAMKHRLVSVELDEESIGRSNPDVEHERKIAIYDLLEQNAFTPVGHEDEGPFALRLSITGARLAFDILNAEGKPIVAHLLSLTPLRRIVKDYYLICDSYYQAIRTATALLVRYTATGEYEYYDLRTDPLELHNIPGQAPAALKAQLAALSTCAGTGCRRAAR